jgi:Zn finger protein HypA/HybF involved in hydrogenase expression
MKKTIKTEDSKESLENKTEEVNESAKDSEQFEKSELTEDKEFQIPGICPKCGSDDVEFDECGDGDVELDLDTQNTIEYSYNYFVCNICKSKARDVFISRYSHTELDEE